MAFLNHILVKIMLLTEGDDERQWLCVCTLHVVWRVERRLAEQLLDLDDLTQEMSRVSKFKANTVHANRLPVWPMILRDSET